MTVKELVEELQKFPDSYNVVLEIDGIVNDCKIVYSGVMDEIILGGTQ